MTDYKTGIPLSSVEPVIQDNNKYESDNPQSEEDYIKQRKVDGATVGEIACELYDKAGWFKLTQLEICRKLDLGNDLQPGQVDAMKKRVRDLMLKTRKRKS